MKIENASSVSIAEVEANAELVIEKYGSLANMRHEDGGWQQDGVKLSPYHIEYWYGSEGEVLASRNGNPPYLMG